MLLLWIITSEKSEPSFSSSDLLLLKKNQLVCLVSPNVTCLCSFLLLLSVFVLPLGIDTSFGRCHGSALEPCDWNFSLQPFLFLTQGIKSKIFSQVVNIIQNSLPTELSAPYSVLILSFVFPIPLISLIRGTNTISYILTWTLCLKTQLNSCIPHGTSQDNFIGRDHSHEEPNPSVSSPTYLSWCSQLEVTCHFVLHLWYLSSWCWYWLVSPSVGLLLWDTGTSHITDILPLIDLLFHYSECPNPHILKGVPLNISLETLQSSFFVFSKGLESYSIQRFCVVHLFYHQNLAQCLTYSRFSIYVCWTEAMIL